MKNCFTVLLIALTVNSFAQGYDYEVTVNGQSYKVKENTLFTGKDANGKKITINVNPGKLKQLDTKQFSLIHESKYPFIHEKLSESDEIYIHFPSMFNMLVVMDLGKFTNESSKDDFIKSYLKDEHCTDQYSNRTDNPLTLSDKTVLKGIQLTVNENNEMIKYSFYFYVGKNGGLIFIQKDHEGKSDLGVYYDKLWSTVKIK